MKKERNLRTFLPVMVVTMMLALIQCAQAQTKNAYVVKSTDGKTLTFYYDTQKASRQGTVWDINSIQTDESDTFPAWSGTIGTTDTAIKNVKFDTSFKDFRPKTTSCWFFNLNFLRRIIGIENLNTSGVTDMSRMFSGCSSLAELDLRSFDASNVTDMTCMFCKCVALGKLDLTNFDTRNVTNMGSMFFGCSSLTELNLTRFDTSNVTDMEEMFALCWSLTRLDLTNFDTRKVTKMAYMFLGCSSLTGLDLTRFDTRNVTDMSYMFTDCSSLTALDLRSFDTRNVTEMDDMFSGCSSLTTIYCNDERIAKLKKN